MKKSISIFGLVEVSAVGLLIVSIASLFDGLSRYFELLSHFKNLYLYCALLLLICTIFYKNVRLAVFALISVFINSFFVLPIYLESEYNSVNGNRHEIKVLLSNVYTGNQEHEKLIRYVLQEDPDIVVLQEIDTNWAVNISELLRHYPYSLLEPRDDNFGIAVLSKIKTLQQDIVYWGELDIPSIQSHFEVGDKSFHLFATHPVPPISEVNYRFRNAQLASVAARAKQISTAKLVVGDLNITSWSSDYKQLQSGTGLRNARQGFGVLATWPVQIPFLRIPIDHVLVSKEFAVQSIATGPDIGSDHLPLVAVLRL